MKRGDILFVLLLAAVFTPFIISQELYHGYHQLNAAHPYILGFLKFALLATMGETLALRIKEGVYNKPGFGILPRAIVWGFLGMSIVLAFTIFAAGAPLFLKTFGVENALASMQGDVSWTRFGAALAISTTMNIFYAPVLMTVHKVTDMHIASTGGTVKGLFTRINIVDHLQQLDWKTHWNFILVKTIPLFWIPMQTINFMLPVEFRVLVAALLGIALGVILATATLKK
ncbi:hypothetical protein EMN47_00785 [Prolixibacteraceae bacterium JC049]|nr:hypothetical protein [Prolixibacteraceae bacterium JC049]